MRCRRHQRTPVYRTPQGAAKALLDETRISIPTPVSNSTADQELECHSFIHSPNEPQPAR